MSVTEYKPGLAMTAKDHKAIGSTPTDVLVSNPEQTFAETMDDGALCRYLLEVIRELDEMHKKARNGSDVDQYNLRVLLEGFLVPNIKYLRQIKRLPKELANLDPIKQFEL